VMSTIFCWNYQAPYREFTSCLCCVAGMLIHITHVKIL
jgi:hypothetical protein